jgi:hypothetical protein
MIATACTNCHSLIRLDASGTGMWVDDQRGIRCEKGESKFTAHIPPGQYMILAKVVDAMSGADSKLGTASTVDYMSAIAKTFQREVDQYAARELGQPENS